MYRQLLPTSKVPVQKAELDSAETYGVFVLKDGGLGADSSGEGIDIPTSEDIIADGATIPLRRSMILGQVDNTVFPQVS